MRLASLPEALLDGLISTVADMPRNEMERFVTNLRTSQDFRADRAVTLNVRRAMQAYRALSLIDNVDLNVREAVQLTMYRAAALLGVDLPAVSLANTSELTASSPMVPDHGEPVASMSAPPTLPVVKRHGFARTRKH